MAIQGQLFVNNNTKEFGLSNSLSNGLLSVLTLKSAVIGLVVNSIKLHFITLTESLFSLNQLFISENALFALFILFVWQDLDQHYQKRCTINAYCYMQH